MTQFKRVFQREVRNAARLIHPNIVVAHDAAEVEGLWFLVMEYIDGRDVSQLLSPRGRPRSAWRARSFAKPLWVCSMPTRAAWFTATSNRLISLSPTLIPYCPAAATVGRRRRWSRSSISVCAYDCARRRGIG